MKHYIFSLLFFCTFVTPSFAQDYEESDVSIYQLESQWKTQDDETVTFKDFKGNTLVVVLIFTSCQTSCPRLVADMKRVKKEVSPHKNKNIKYLLISIDPDTDTPQVLKQFAADNELDNDQWVLLNGADADVREFANVVAVSYKEISPINFSHSNIISVFNTAGELKFQQQGFKDKNTKLVNTIIKL